MLHSPRFFRLVFVSVVLAISLLLYNVPEQFKATFPIGLYGLAAIVPIAGAFFLTRHVRWKHPKRAFLWAAGLLGFITFAWSFIGMILDQAAHDREAEPQSALRAVQRACALSE